MKKLYKLTPTLHANIWGGNNLREYGKISSEDRIGESWELSFVPGNEAKIHDGRTTRAAFGKELWGKRCEGFESFPVLTKFIDAKDNLSVQVHPSDDYALANEGQYGKSEMWYVVSAEEGAGLYMGLSRECDTEEFKQRVADGTVEEVLSFKKVKPGDVFFIPAGTIHAIGAGTLIFEIQQNSTLTYRLYDYMRRDKQGNLRELHVDKAMKVSSLSVYEPQSHGENDKIIGECKYFITKRYDTNDFPITISVTDQSYLSLTSVRGEGEISYEENGTVHTEKISLGDTFFAPAGQAELTVSGDMTLITVET